MSQILEIIQAIGNVSVNTATQTPIVYGVEDAVKSVRTLPARIIFPISTGDNEGETRYVTLGNTMEHTWTIVDIMLYHSKSNTSNQLMFMSELVSYVANYKAAFQSKANQGLGLDQVNIVGFDTQWVDLEFPEKSDNEYHGVICTLEITEIDQ